MADHGTRTTYSRGCRCEPCSEVNKDYLRQLRADRRQQNRNLPAAPLFDLWRDDNDDRTIAEACGVTRGTVGRWRRHGINRNHADSVACRLGLHPAYIWGHDWWNA